MKSTKKRLKNKISKLLFGALGLVIASIITISSDIVNKEDSTIVIENTNSDTIKLSKCVDGDTAYFMVNGEEEKVRFLAVDAPETVKSGTPVQSYEKEASEYTCKSLMSAANINFDYEDTNKTDKYNRLLAWVFIDGKLLQGELVAKGYAQIKYEKKNYKYIDELYAIQEVAKENKVGIWRK